MPFHMPLYLSRRERRSQRSSMSKFWIKSVGVWYWLCVKELLGKQVHLRGTNIWEIRRNTKRQSKFKPTAETLAGARGGEGIEEKMCCVKMPHSRVVVGLVVVLFFTHSPTNLARASLPVTEQASSSSDTDKEIAFISDNGSHLDVSKTTLSTATRKAETDTDTGTGTGTEKTDSSGRSLKRGKRYLDFISNSRTAVGIFIKMQQQIHNLFRIGIQWRIRIRIY